MQTLVRIVKWRSSAAYWMNPPIWDTCLCVSNGVAHVSPSQPCKWPDRSRVRFLFKFALEVRTQVRTSPHQHPLAWTLQAYWSVLARTWVATSNQMQNGFDLKIQVQFCIWIVHSVGTAGPMLSRFTQTSRKSFSSHPKCFRTFEYFHAFLPPGRSRSEVGKLPPYQFLNQFHCRVCILQNTRMIGR